MAKCALCGCDIDKKDIVRYKEKNYHPKCYEENKDREELSTYICRLFSLKAPGPRNYSLIKKYHFENGYSYRGMINSLEYFFEIKNNKKEKANESIGIIPYIYNEAQQYFLNINKKNKDIKKVVEEQIETEKKQINIKIPKRENKKKVAYSLENL